MMKKRFTLGAVAYAPKVVTIWDGFKTHFEQQGFEFDYILYSNYEAQVEAMFAGVIDAAWNSPLASIRADRIGKTLGTPVKYGPMRDTDQGLHSVLVVNKNSKIETIRDLVGKKIGFGAIDSPQARLIPLDHLKQVGLAPVVDFLPKLFDVLGGKHGDHIGGEREAAIALLQGEIDATWMIDSNYQAFSKEGTLPTGETRILAQTGAYDHCIFSISPQAPEMAVARFCEILLAMKWSDSNVRHLLELEGLKEWRKGRTEGFVLLNRAVDDLKFYDARGEIIEANYRY